jgi:hypothetical protein
MLRFLKPGLGAAVFGVRLLIAFAAPPLSFAAFAHEAHPQAEQAATSDESAFFAENEVAMARMMSAMEAKPTGDIDRDFVAMMAPHHQGGIDMAVLQLRYGKNEQLRRLAQEIIVSQTQEIAAMKLAIREQVTASVPAPAQGAPTPTHDHMSKSAATKK